MFIGALMFLNIFGISSENSEEEKKKNLSQIALIFAKSATWRFRYKLIEFLQEQIIWAAVHSNSLYSYSMSSIDSFESIFIPPQGL